MPGTVLGTGDLVENNNIKPGPHVVYDMSEWVDGRGKEQQTQQKYTRSSSDKFCGE